jgi:Mor family transcriptional regulator
MIRIVKKIKMASIDYNIMNIINDIESGSFSVDQIIEKYKLNKYKYYKILKEAEIKNPSTKIGAPCRPKNTPFKKLLNQKGGNGDEHISDPDEFDLDAFKQDCEKGMKLTELMEKYKLSLYQVRELRKKYDLKTK